MENGTEKFEEKQTKGNVFRSGMRINCNAGWRHLDDGQKSRDVQRVGPIGWDLFSRQRLKILSAQMTETNPFFFRSGLVFIRFLGCKLTYLKSVRETQPNTWANIEKHREGRSRTGPMEIDTECYDESGQRRPMPTTQMNTSRKCCFHVHLSISLQFQISISIQRFFWKSWLYRPVEGDSQNSTTALLVRIHLSWSGWPTRRPIFCWRRRRLFYSFKVINADHRSLPSTSRTPW